ncbi:MAG: HDIG domain-containing protein [Synergistaceae bacterium]|nr:HDIG domain-containing protein [Synergistaceae bacterium]
MFSREESLKFLKEHNKEKTHIRHAFAVEAAMRAFARYFDEDEEYWGLIGLMHDIDWEEFPSIETHPMKGAEMLTNLGYPEDFVRAVLAHGWESSGVKPETLCEKTLYTVDELTGFITAVALVRPSKSLMDLEVKSVKKKWKDKGFARGVNRAIIEKGSELMGEPLETLISLTIEALKPIENNLGLGA